MKFYRCPKCGKKLIQYENGIFYFRFGKEGKSGKDWVPVDLKIAGVLHIKCLSRNCNNTIVLNSLEDLI